MDAALTAPEKPEYFLFKEFYDGPQPFYYNTADYPWVKELEKNWHVIVDEMGYLMGEKVDFENNSYYPPNLSSPDAWKNIVFYNYCWKNTTNCKRFPKTHELLKSIPNLTYAGLCLLEPNSAVLPHYGDTNTTIRCHLGIKIPGTLPECGMKVGDEDRPWQEGKLLMFCDAQRHTTWNKTDKRRYVFTMDVMRDEYKDEKVSICSKVLGVYTLKYFDQRIKFINRIPNAIVSTMHFFVSAAWYAFLRLQGAKD
jgi:aspartyl/asparaginyl beta-hydroxylase (cupin superfamily)